MLSHAAINQQQHIVFWCNPLSLRSMHYELYDGEECIIVQRRQYTIDHKYKDSIIDTHTKLQYTIDHKYEHSIIHIHIQFDYSVLTKVFEIALFLPKVRPFLWSYKEMHCLRYCLLKVSTKTRFWSFYFMFYVWDDANYYVSPKRTFRNQNPCVAFENR